MDVEDSKIKYAFNNNTTWLLPCASSDFSVGTPKVEIMESIYFDKVYTEATLLSLFSSSRSDCQITSISLGKITSFSSVSSYVESKILSQDATTKAITVNAKSMNSTFPDALKFTISGYTADSAVSVSATIVVDIRNSVALAKSANASSGFTVPIPLAVETEIID